MAEELYEDASCDLFNTFSIDFLKLKRPNMNNNVPQTQNQWRHSAKNTQTNGGSGAPGDALSQSTFFQFHAVF